jgi:hypothetical protein
MYHILAFFNKKYGINRIFCDCDEKLIVNGWKIDK